MQTKKTNNHLGQVPPQAVEVEQALLGAILLESEAIRKVNGTLAPEMFYEPEHRELYKIIQDMSLENKAIDLMTVTQRIREMGKAEELTPLFITQLTTRVASAAHLDFHVRIVIEKHLLRSMIAKCSEIQKMAYGDEDIEEITSAWKATGSEILNAFSAGGTGTLQKEVVKNTMLEIEKDYQAAQKDQSPGITTGLNKLDNALGGWRPTNLIVLAARPGVGKTSLALHFAKVAAMAGKWVNFFSLEMAETDLGRIMISSECNVNRTSIRDGRLNQSDWPDLHHAVGKLENLPIIWKNAAGMNVNQIVSTITRNRENGRCDIAIIDYIQLVKPLNKKAIREQQVGEVSNELKQTALGEGIPIIGLAQLNRLADSEVPRPSHLRESGSLEQDADIILLPYRDKNDDSYKIIIGKNRRGSEGYVEVAPNSEMTRFEEPNCFPEVPEPEYSDDLF